MPQPKLTDTGESYAVGGSGAQDPRWEIFFLIFIEKDASELGDTTRRVFPALFWEGAVMDALLAVMLADRMKELSSSRYKKSEFGTHNWWQNLRVCTCKTLILLLFPPRLSFLIGIDLTYDEREGARL